MISIIIGSYLRCPQACVMFLNNTSCYDVIQEHNTYLRTSYSYFFTSNFQYFRDSLSFIMTVTVLS